MPTAASRSSPARPNSARVSGPRSRRSPRKNSDRAVRHPQRSSPPTQLHGQRRLYLRQQFDEGQRHRDPERRGAGAGACWSRQRRGVSIYADETLRTENGAVIAPDGRRMSYGDLVAAEICIVQAQPTSKLKDPSTFKVMGQPMQRVDIPGKGHRRRGLRAGHAAARHGARPRRAPAELRRATDVPRHSRGGKTARRRQGRSRRQLPRRRRRRSNFRRSRRCAALSSAAKWNGRPPPCRSRHDLPTRADQPAVAGHDDLPAERSHPSPAAKTIEATLYPAVSGARLDRAVLRGGAIHRWRDDGVDAHARRLSRSSGHRGNAADAARERALHSCRRLRLLRPQWRRRRGRRCRA